MKKPILFLAAAAALAAGAVPALAQEMDDAAMMKAWQEFMTPGAAHSELAKLAGEWDFTMKMWQDPAAPPMETEGTSKMTMIMGGRYLKEETEANVMGMPMTGLGIVGYNNATKKYENIWLDNMGTGIIHASGSKEGNAITMTGQTADPMSGGMSDIKMVTRFEDDDHYVFEFWQDANGTMMKVMEGHYTRKGGKAMKKGGDEGGW